MGWVKLDADNVIIEINKMHAHFPIVIISHTSITYFVNQYLNCGSPKKQEENSSKGVSLSRDNLQRLYLYHVLGRIFPR